MKKAFTAENLVRRESPLLFNIELRIDDITSELYLADRWSQGAANLWLHDSEGLFIVRDVPPG